MNRIPRMGAIICMIITLSGCAGAHRALQEQNFQTPMIPISDVRAIFAGDSITANWQTAKDERDTGMPGQNSTTIRLRLEAEIKAGSPRYVHILAGSNDDVRFPQITVSEIHSMVLTAKSKTQIVIVGTVPPMDASKFWQAPYIPALNAAIVADVVPLGATIADYYSAMILPGGAQNSALFDDSGIHPNAAGYAVMDDVLHQALRKAYREARLSRYTPEQRAAWASSHPQLHYGPERRAGWSGSRWTPEQRTAWRAAHPDAGHRWHHRGGGRQYTPEQRAAWRAAHPRPATK